MEVAGKKVLVMGAARSGIACAKFLAQRGATVALNDAKPIEEWTAEALALKKQGIGCLPGEVPGWLLDQIDLLVVSPGVPVKAFRSDMRNAPALKSSAKSSWLRDF